MDVHSNVDERFANTLVCTHAHIECMKSLLRSSLASYVCDRFNSMFEFSDNDFHTSSGNVLIKKTFVCLIVFAVRLNTLNFSTKFHTNRRIAVHFEFIVDILLH